MYRGIFSKGHLRLCMWKITISFCISLRIFIVIHENSKNGAEKSIYFHGLVIKIILKKIDGESCSLAVSSRINLKIRKNINIFATQVLQKRI